MDSETVAVVGTATVGIAGIAATYLTGRAQRKADERRVARERRDRYRYAEYERRSNIYADFLATLQSVHTQVSLQNRIDSRFRNTWAQGLPDKLRADAEKFGEPTSTQMRDLADALERDPELGPKLAADRPRLGPRFDVDVVEMTQTIVALEARISVIASHEMAVAAWDARSAATALLLRVSADRLVANADSVEEGLASLVEATGRVGEAAIYELRLQPFGERSSLADLRRQAEAEAAEDGAE